MTHMFRILSIAASLSLGACAGSGQPAPSANCEIDPARVISWSDYHLVDETPPPNVFHYSGCGRNLVYIAAQHTNDPASATFAQVRAALKRWPPDILIAEGFPEAMGESPAALLDHSRQMKGTPGDSEGSEAIRIVSDAGGAFVGGEPGERTVLAGLEARGLSAADMFALYVIRQIDQWKRERRLTDHRDPRLNDLIGELAKMTARDLGIPMERLSAVSTREGVAAWYERTNKLPFDTGYRPQDSYPTGPQNNLPTNALSDMIGDIRDRHIISVIAKALDRHATVAVVYGNSHHSIAAPAFREAFGSPRFSGRLS